MASPTAMAADDATPIDTIVADTTGEGDTDSAVSVPVSSSLTSLRSSVYNQLEENGRTYHGFSSGKYPYPNDSKENERLELQHYIWLLSLKGELCLCPKAAGAKHVLDLGTGTGCWAIDYADAHPDAEVIGVDLSPIQPTLTPPNCSFEIDDLEKEWTWTKPFDFLFSRVISGSFNDNQEFINKAYKMLEPGGWFEMQDIAIPYGCDDGTLDPESDMGKASELFIKGAANLGRPIDQAPQFGDMMTRAGFETVTLRKLKWPLNTWPRDRHYKDLGAANFVSIDSGVEGMVQAVFTRGLKWSIEDTLVFCSAYRRQLRDTRIHAYLNVYVWYGQKPGGESGL